MAFSCCFVPGCVVVRWAAVGVGFYGLVGLRRWGGRLSSAAGVIWVRCCLLSCVCGCGGVFVSGGCGCVLWWEVCVGLAGGCSGRSVRGMSSGVALDVVLSDECGWALIRRVLGMLCD